MIELKNKKIIVNAPAKINLHLEVIGKRKDGYHELAMIMQSINLYDVLEIEANQEGHLNLSTDSNQLSDNDDNLIMKAAILLKKISKKKNLGANIKLKKNIPIGAGLAGGSSDAAATLLGLNKLWKLNIDDKDIKNLASKIGSDVPFCINGGSQFCFGRGEILEKCDLFSNYALILLKSKNLSISTSEIYKKYSQENCENMTLSDIKIKDKRKNLKLRNFSKNGFINENISLQNDLQNIVKRENPSVFNALNLLRNLDKSLFFSMSGSGPSCFAIFDNLKIAKEIYYQNIEIFKKYGYDSWFCNFCNTGVTFT
tara:strand:- start:5247 stop:6185 length:939 start_codon:yes stop_codon:yes gene_type:complete